MKPYENKQALNDEILKNVAGGDPAQQKEWEPGEPCPKCGSEVCCNLVNYYCTNPNCEWSIDFSQV